MARYSNSPYSDSDEWGEVPESDSESKDEYVTDYNARNVRFHIERMVAFEYIAFCEI